MWLRKMLWRSWNFCENVAVDIIVEALITDVAVAVKVELAISNVEICSVVRVWRVEVEISGEYRSVVPVGGEFFIFNNDCLSVSGLTDLPKQL